VQGSIGAEPLPLVNGTAAAAPPRLRVALDATPLLGFRTGVGVFCHGALEALGVRPDLDVRAFAVSWRRQHAITEHLPAGVTAPQRPMPARPLHAVWTHAAVPPLEWFIGPVDVVHGTNFVVPPTRRAGAVVSVHDLTPFHHPELANRATLAFPGLIRRAVRRGAWVHTDSAFVAAEVVEAVGADPSRVRVVHPGVPPLSPLDAHEAGLLVDHLLPAGTTRFVLSLGTAEPRKDLPGLVRAFDAVASRHGDIALVLAGPPGWGEDALVTSIATAGAAARIVQAGWVAADVRAALLARATVLAYPSLYEGFGFPPLEAMSLGVPVVATRAGSLPEVLGDGALLVDVGDHEGLAGALEQVLEDDAVRRRLVDAGTARAATYSWERCGDGLEQLYRDVAATRE
jgi:glycosyltransferase involved in cell wall biosynthesis